MRYELRRRLTTIARSLHELGDEDNARALARRLLDGTAEEWLGSEHGEHVWAEIGGAFSALRRLVNHLPFARRAAVVHAEVAYREAETFLSHRAPVLVARAA